MHAIYELKDMLCKELEDYGSKGTLSSGMLDTVDKMAHTIKNLDKIIETMEDEEYSNYGGDVYGDMTGPVHGRSYGGVSHARGRGRNARRDSMGRYSSRGYSRAGDIVDRLRDLMADAPDETTRMEIQRLVSQMEQR